jgi:hypothetical protein
MRNFKFRVWDGEKMLSHDEIGGFAIDDLSNGLWVESMLSLTYRDKNGTEVFQDDILKILKINRTSDHKYTEYSVATTSIPWGDMLGQVVDFEIVGNLHENPEIRLEN